MTVLRQRAAAFFLAVLAALAPPPPAAARSDLDAMRSRDARAAAPRTAPGEDDLPLHLRSQPQKHYCLNGFGTPSREACDTLIKEILRDKGRADCTLGRLDCLGIAMRTGYVGKTKRKALIAAILEWRAEQADLHRREAERARAEAGGAVETRSFDIDGERLTLPLAYRVAPGANMGGRIKVQVWTNMLPAAQCPETALLKTRIGLGTNGGDEACRGRAPREVIFHAFDQGRLIGSEVLSGADQAGRRKDGTEWLMTSFLEQVTSWARPYSRYID
ncbi:hypothetical protein ACQ5SO_11680 [Rhodovulum sp. DZ06]|uniref:hypothetical protein n=1 Tax=Rhodovulum sp. DZ06 TaxID=3425126 RepID=UPI003D33D2B7